MWRRAWRNLWRNPRRSAITVAAISLNTIILIASLGLMKGMLLHTIRSATGTLLGEVQVHAPGYLEDRSLYRAIHDPAAVLEAARAAGVTAATRVHGYGLVAHETKSAGALLTGLDPTVEREAFLLAGHLATGTFLAPDPQRGILLGNKLARSLQAEVGAELVLVVQAADGSLGNDLYHVAGIFKSVGEAFDRGAAIVHERDFRELYVLGDRIHEIALIGAGERPAETIAAAVRAAAPEEDVRTWRELIPILADVLNLFDVSMAIFAGIFLLAAGLGVMNTMLMATYERTREFGLLKALGTTPLGVVLEVTAEAILLAVVGTALGTALGLLSGLYLEKVGIDTAAWAGETTFGGVAFDPLWRASIDLQVVAWPVVAMWAVALLAALYPAVRAARLDPVPAMRHV